MGKVVDTSRLYARFGPASCDVRLIPPAGTPASRPAAIAAVGRNCRRACRAGQFVGRSADPQTGNFPVRVLFDNPGPRFGVGQMVNVEIVVTERSALAVPSGRLDLEEGPAFAVVRQGKSAVLHPGIGLRERLGRSPRERI